MKRKLLLFVLIALAMFLFVGCGEEREQDPPEYEGKEFLNAPVNLEISDKLLSWKAVEHATEYHVYIDGKKKATVTGTSYDFSNLSGSYYVFNVVAVGDGYANSEKSLSIAYHKDMTNLIAQIIAIASENDMEIDETFAREIIKRGMTAEQFTKETKALCAWSDKMGLAEDFDSYKTAMKGLLEANITIEAYASAFLFMNKQNLQHEYDDTYDFFEKEMLGTILDLYENEYENLVLAISNTVNYLLDVYEYCADDVYILLNEIDSSLMEEPETAFAIKDEIISAFLEKMPNVQDLTLVYRLISCVFSGNDVEPLPAVKSLSAYANATLLELEFTLKFLKTIDYAFLEEIQGKFETANTELEVAVDVLLIIKEKYDTFLNDHQSLKESIDNALTDAQRKDMALSLIMVQLGFLKATSAVNIDIDPELIYDLLNNQYEFFKHFIDYEVDTDFELFKRLNIYNGYECVAYYPHDYPSDVYYYNTVTGEDFDSFEEFDLSKNIDQFKFFEELFNVYNTLMPYIDVNDSSYFEFIRLIADLSAESDDYNLIMAYLDFLESNILEIKDVFDALCVYVVEEDVFGAFITVMEREKADYISGEVDEENYNYTYIKMAIKHIEAFYTDNEVKITSLINKAFTLIKDQTNLGNTPFEYDEVVQTEDHVNELIDEALALMRIIKTYDPDILTEDQIAKIDDLLELFEEK